MADPIFNHNLFSFQSIKKAAAGSIQDYLYEQLFSEFNDMVIRHSAVEDPDNPGGFIPSKNFIASFLQAISSPANADRPQVGDMSTADLIDGLKLIPGTLIEQQGVGVEQSAGRTSLVLNELLRRANESKTQSDFIKAQFKAKSDIDAEFRGEESTGIVPAAEVATCGLALCIKGDSDARKRLTAEARKVVRACTRGPQDGKRVSREPHEWRYCRFESEQWQDMLDAVDNAVILGDLTASTNQTDYTYGNFVDAVKARKLIALMRKVRRAAYSANVKFVVDSIPNMDQEQFYLQLVGQIDQSIYDAVAVELNEIMNPQQDDA